MPKVSELARVTTPDGTVWHACTCCGLLVPQVSGRAFPAGTFLIPCRPCLCGLAGRGWA
jgi:hypothetical protein